MKLKAIVHQSEEGGFWAEVPAIPDCVTQGETMEELQDHLREAIAASVELELSSSPEPTQEEGAPTEPEFFRFVGSIRVGAGSPVVDVRAARRLRGRE